MITIPILEPFPNTMKYKKNQWTEICTSTDTNSDNVQNLIIWKPRYIR